MVKIQRILVPTDFSEPGKTALMYAVEIAKQFHAEVDLLHVFEPIPPGMLLNYDSQLELRRHARAEAEKQLDELYSKWEGCTFPVHKVIVEGYPFVEIVRHAKENNVDLIIMGTHGLGPIRHMLLGSVAEKTVCKAPCPVLTVKHPEHEFVHP